MKKFIAVLVVAICSFAFADEQTNKVDCLGRPTEWNGIPILYGGQAQACIPICIDDKIEEFANNGGAVIYIGNTNIVIIDNWINTNNIDNGDTNYLPSSTNKQWKAEDFCVSNAYWTNYWTSSWISSNTFCLDLNEVKSYKTTWVYKDFSGRVSVTFDVDGWGFPDSTRRLLEEEIAKAIQDIIDLHFPKESK